MIKNTFDNKQQERAANWFEELRDQICSEFAQLEEEYSLARGLKSGVFERKIWQRDSSQEKGDAALSGDETGGGQMSLMRGNLFEKLGVNISTVFGDFSEEFRAKIPGAEDDGKFFATGISIVAHMSSPLVPAVHFNTRYIETSKSWFGGGGDLTPMYPDDVESLKFHKAFEAACDRHDPSYYPKFKKACDEYFFLHHRKEARGIGGIFYDYLNTGNFENDFAFTMDIGNAFKFIYLEIVRDKMDLTWTRKQREHQLKKRGRYVEFNLLYDRGTTFGLKTGGNVEAILMSLPPEVKW